MKSGTGERRGENFMAGRTVRSRTHTAAHAIAGLQLCSYHYDSAIQKGVTQSLREPAVALLAPDSLAGVSNAMEFLIQ